MYSRILIASALVVAFVIPAGAATTAKKPAAKTYYAEQTVKSKACYVVTFKPNGKTAAMIGDGSFDSMSKALAAIKADKDCKAPKIAMKKPAPAKPKT